MSLAQLDREIAGLNVSVTEFPARLKLRIQYRVAKVLGPFMGSGISALTQGGSDSLLEASVDGEVIGKALQRAFTELPENDYMNLLQTILSGTRVNNVPLDKPEVIDVTFTGTDATANIFKTVLFAWEVNYGPLPIGRLISLRETFIGSKQEEAGDTPRDKSKG